MTKNKTDNTATATTTTTKAPKAQYPFRSKASIATQLATDDAFVLTCLQVMLERQTEHEVATKSTLNKNSRGFMSSHAVNGTALAQKAATEGLDAEEAERAKAIVCRYTKQLAEHFRSEALAADPSLAAVAAVFGC